MVDRVSAANYTTVAGKRVFQDTNLSAGITGTELAAQWHTGIQESVIEPVEFAGLTPTDADNTQLWQTIQQVSGAAVTTLAASTTLTRVNIGLVLVSAAAGNVVVTLPQAAALAGTGNGAGTVNSAALRLIRTDTTANTVTVQRGGTDTLAPGAQTSYAMLVGENMLIASDGVSAWYQIETNMLGRRSQSFTASGTLNIGAWVTRIRVRAWGAGGGGGATTVSSTGSGGGSGGGYSSGEFAVTPGSALAVTIGAGGSYGSPGVAGGAGGTTSVGSLITATGGGGGAVIGGGGPIGIGVGGTVNISGNGGNGEGGAFGGQGGGAFSSSASFAQAQPGGGAGGCFPGGGAGGGSGGYPGGPGAAGLVLVEY